MTGVQTCALPICFPVTIAATTRIRAQLLANIQNCYLHFSFFLSLSFFGAYVNGLFMSKNIGQIHLYQYTIYTATYTPHNMILTKHQRYTLYQRIFWSNIQLSLTLNAKITILSQNIGSSIHLFLQQYFLAK